MSMHRRQHGGSAIGLIIILAIVGYGVFTAIQYVPQYIESATVKTILDNVEDAHNKERFNDATAVRNAIDKQLYINEMSDLKDSFTVTPSRGGYIVTVHYERKLNLLFENKPMPYEKTIRLK